MKETNNDEKENRGNEKISGKYGNETDKTDQQDFFAGIQIDEIS